MMDKCRETEYRGENFDEKIEIYVLVDGNSIPRVQTALAVRTKWPLVLAVHTVT